MQTRLTSRRSCSRDAGKQAERGDRSSAAARLARRTTRGGHGRNDGSRVGADVGGGGWRQVAARHGWLDRVVSWRAGQTSSLSPCWRFRRRGRPAVVDLAVVWCDGPAGKVARHHGQRPGTQRGSPGWGRTAMPIRVSARRHDPDDVPGALIMAAKGGLLSEITVGDVVELLDAEAEVHGGRSAAPSSTGLSTRWESSGPRRRRAAALRTTGQRSPEELIDRYNFACRPVRDLLVDYLKERQPALDYNSLETLANRLGERFWADLEAHHPGIDSLRLPVEVASAWKRACGRFEEGKDRDRRESRCRRPTAQLPRVPDPGAVLVLGPGPLGGRRPGAMGCVGGAMPCRRGGGRLAQGRAAAQVTHGPANARTPAGAPLSRAGGRRGTQGNSDVARGGPSGRARRGLQPCRVDLRQARAS